MIPWIFADVDTIIDNYSEYEKWKMRKSCVRCSHIRLQDISNPCDDCTNFCNWKPKTNADWVRSMSDEELAEIISSLGNCDTCYLYLNRGCNINTSCKDAVLEWLRKDADEKTIRKTEENADTFQQN